MLFSGSAAVQVDLQRLTTPSEHTRVTNLHTNRCVVGNVGFSVVRLVKDQFHVGGSKRGRLNNSFSVKTKVLLLPADTRTPSFMQRSSFVLNVLSDFICSLVR